MKIQKIKKRYAKTFNKLWNERFLKFPTGYNKSQILMFLNSINKGKKKDRLNKENLTDLVMDLMEGEYEGILAKKFHKNHKNIDMMWFARGLEIALGFYNLKTHQEKERRKYEKQ